MTQKAHDNIMDMFAKAHKRERAGNRDGALNMLRKAASVFEDHDLEDASQSVWDIVRRGKRDKEFNLSDEIDSVQESEPVTQGIRAVRETSEEDDPETKKVREDTEFEKASSAKQKETKALARYMKSQRKLRERALETGPKGGKYYTIAGGKKVYVKG
jgi:hypothetical protein